MDAQAAGNFMRAFGDGTRLRILAALSVRPITVGDLTRLLGCPEQRVSRHLRYLHARGVVECSPKRKAVEYRLSGPRHPVHRAILSALRSSIGTIDEARADQERLRKTAGK